jgi:MFS family permease
MNHQFIISTQESDMRGCSEVSVATPAWRQSRLMQWIPVFPAPVPRLLGSSLVFVMGRAVSLPLVVLYLAQALQLSQTRIGWMLAFASLVATLSGPLAGMLADRIAKTRLMAIACMIAAAAVLMLSVSPNAGLRCWRWRQLRQRWYCAASA